MKEPLDLVCESNNQITRMCTRSTCKEMSLICDQKDCLTCPKNEHKKCLKIDLDGVAQTINTHLPQKLEVIEIMDNLYF